MRRQTLLVAALAAVAGTAVPVLAQPADDWEVTRDPFDRAVIGRYKAILARNPHDAGALAKLLELYRRYRTIDLLKSEYQKVLDKTPADGAALVIMARLARSTNDLAGAAALWEKAAAARPTDGAVWIELGENFGNAGKSAEARAAYDKALATTLAKADKARALRALANLALAAGDIDGARGLFDKMIAIDPRDVQLRLELGDSLAQAGKRAEAIAVYRDAEKMLGADPARKVEVVSRIGQTLEAKGDDDLAIGEYKRAIALAPKGYYIENELTARIIDIYRRKQQLPDLLAGYEKQWAEGSRGFFEWDTLARLYEETGQQDKAIAAYQKAVARSPYELETQRRLIQLLENVGKDDQALKQLERVAQVAPGEARFQLELAERYWRKDQQAKALATLGHVVERFPGDAGVQSTVAELYARWGKDNLALAAYERLATLEPDDPNHLVTLGEQYFARGDKPKALATWKRIATSGKAIGFAKLGEVMSEHGMTADALANFAKAIKLEPQNPAHYRGRAQVYESTKNYADALTDWQKVLSLLGTKVTDRAARRDARRKLVAVLVRWGQREGELRSQWQAAFKKSPPDADAGYFLVEYYAKRPQVGEPIATLTRLHQVAADDQEVTLDLVKAHRQAQAYDTAIALLLELAKQAPTREREVFTQIASIKAEQRKDAEAIEWSQKALAKSPNDPVAYLQMAERFVEMQKLPEAIQAYEKSIELDARNWKAYFALGALEIITNQPAKAADLYRAILNRSTDDDILQTAGKDAIELEEMIGSLGELEKVVAPLSFTMAHKPVYRRVLVELFLRHVPRLAARARRGSPELRQAARDELARLGQHGMRPLLEALHDEKDVNQQRVAVTVLGYLGNKGAAAPLIHLASEKPPADPDAARRIGTLTQTLDWEVRVDALVAAGRLGDPSVLPLVQPLTSHVEVAMREAAIFTAGRTADRRALPVLTTALADRRESVQALACLGLAQSDDPRSAPVMANVVGDRKRNDLVRAACAFGLGHRKASAGVGALVTALGDNSGEAQRVSAWALGQLGDARALAPLVRAYFGRADGRRDELAWALARLASPGAPPAPDGYDFAEYPARGGKLHTASLVAALPGPLAGAVTAPPVAVAIAHPDDVIAGLRAALAEHRDVVVVVLADLDGRADGLALGGLVPASPDAATGRALDAIGHGIAADVLAHAKDPDPRVRALVASVGAKIDAAGIDAVIAAGLADDAPQVRAAAMQATVALRARRGTTPAPLRDALQKALTAPAWEDRRAAATALGSLGADADPAALGKALADDTGYVREAAAAALGAIKATAAVDALIAASHDELAPVRAAVARALVAIGDPRGQARLRELASDPDPVVAAAARAP